MKTTPYLLLLVYFILFSCSKQVENTNSPTLSSYFEPTLKGIQTGGVQLIPLIEGKDTFSLWTKRIGNNPKIKVLLLNGGPGATHEYFECFENFLPKEGIEFIYYDQLGTGRSTNPMDTSYWDLARYVEEVETVRKALNLNKDNFYLLGHSWGGILAMEYAVKYKVNLKGLIISNMMASCPAYDKYAEEVLAPQMESSVLNEIRALEAANDFGNPRYMEILIPNFYEKHVCRIPAQDWPEPMSRSLNQTNQSLYVTMQGPSEFGLSGKLEQWNRMDDLKHIKVPTLVIGATHDTMDPAYMEKMANSMENGSFLLCPKGSHMCMYDDQERYMYGLIKFLNESSEGQLKITF
jgi:proline iminopeptidase